MWIVINEKSAFLRIPRLRPFRKLVAVSYGGNLKKKDEGGDKLHMVNSIEGVARLATFPTDPAFPRLR